MRLEIGSGYHPDMSFDTHLDINPNCPHVEYVRSADDLSIFLDNSAEEIRANDVLEHFSYRDTIRVLREWYRVLKSGGKIYIQCPDAKHLAKQWLDGTLPLLTTRDGTMPIDFSASYWIMGGQEDENFAKKGDDWRFNAHYTLFSPESMAFYLKTAGFKSWDIQSDGGSNLMVWAYK